MKTQLYDGSWKITVDTKRDTCLYSLPRPAEYSSEIQRQGKDLCFHKDREKILFYLYRWSSSKAHKDQIIPVSATTAERFLRSKGVTCTMFPQSDAVTTLYSWGYGIAEEF